LDGLIKRDDVLLDMWTRKKKKQNCAANDGLPQHVRLQGTTSPSLIKTRKAISNGPVSRHLQAHKKS
jgi:hypothetical protein